VQLGDHPEVELEEVDVPESVRSDPVHPARGCLLARWQLPVVQMEVREPVPDGVLCTEHQQPGHGRSLATGFPVPSPGSHLAQEADLVLQEEGVVRPLGPEQVPVPIQGRPMDPEWVKNIQEKCKRKMVPFFFKQWGGVNKKRAGRVLDGKTWDGMPDMSVGREEVGASG
jgi:hypothetical protein